MSLTLPGALAILPHPLHALVVGGTAGIGLGVAKQLCTESTARVTIAGRNAAVAAQLCADCPTQTMEFKRVDASSMKQIRVFCREIAQSLKDQQNKLNFLVLSQGIISGKIEPTDEGIDVALALNYYGRMLIIRELSDLGAFSDDAIIVSVLNAKVGDTSGERILWDDLDISRGIYGYFSIAKILKHNFSMQDIMLQHLAARAPTRTFVHDYPGFVTTEIMANARLPGPVKWIAQALSWASKGKYVTPAFAGSKIIIGAVESWQKTKDTGKSCFYINDLGFEIDKKQSPEDVRNRIAEHTWNLIDQACAVGNVKVNGVESSSP